MRRWNARRARRRGRVRSFSSSYIPPEPRCPSGFAASAAPTSHPNRDALPGSRLPQRLHPARTAMVHVGAPAGANAAVECAPCPSETPGSQLPQLLHPTRTAMPFWVRSFRSAYIPPEPRCPSGSAGRRGSSGMLSDGFLGGILGFRPFICSFALAAAATSSFGLAFPIIGSG